MDAIPYPNQEEIIMGTRALIHVKDDRSETTLVTIYRQFDGYPEGLGADLRAIVAGKTIVNGYNDPVTQINGAGCLAAQIIANLKEGCGNVYIYPPNSEDVGEEYTYTISCDAGRVMVQCLDVLYKTVIYEGPLSEWVIK